MTIARSNREAGRSQAAFATIALALIAGGVLAGVVVWRGWIADDAFISFRYSRNIVHGYGPVFNPGEHVQAFTHPLWLLLITAGYAIYPQPLWVGVALGATLTVLTFLVIGKGLLAEARSSWGAAAMVVVLALLFGSSEAWREFQASGLENSLSGLIVALLVVEVFRADWRAGRLSLLATLLVLNRPDYLLLVAPLGLVALASLRPRAGEAFDASTLLRLALGTLPLLVWLAFSAAYYHALVPNTAVAKIGIFTTSQGIDAGAAYVWDWLRLEWLPAGGCGVMLVAALLGVRRPMAVALLIGAGLYLAYVVYIGGDFMRGRMLLIVFETFSVLGAMALVRSSAWRPFVAMLACVAAIVAAVVFQLARPPLDGQLSKHGIVWERQFYWGFQVEHLSFGHGKVTGGWSDGHDYHYLDSFLTLHAYVSACGPVTVHAYMIGFLGYNAGPDIHVIDLLGLTDKTIARLPRSDLLHQPPRPGHPEKLIPIAYLAGRGDVSILDGWWDSLKAKDCSLTSRALAHAGDPGMYDLQHPEATPLQ